jgi:hypothetical protein
MADKKPSEPSNAAAAPAKAAPKAAEAAAPSQNGAAKSVAQKMDSFITK